MAGFVPATLSGDDMSTYLFIGGPASGKRLVVPAGPYGAPQATWMVARMPSTPPHVFGSYGVSELASQAIYHAQQFMVDGRKRYIFVWDGMGAADAFDLLVERFPK